MKKYSRREFNVAVLATGLSIAREAHAEEGDTGSEEESAGGGSAARTEAAQLSAYELDYDKYNISDWVNNGIDPTGLFCRAPALGDHEMSTPQKIATGTADTPTAVGVGPGDYSPDPLSRSTPQNSEDFLDKASQQLKEASNYLTQNSRDLFSASIGGFYDPRMDNQITIEKLVASLPPIPDSVSNSIQGFGSAVSFGATDKINDWLGVGSLRNEQSNDYEFGNLLGQVPTFFYGAAAMRGAAWLGSLGRDYEELRFINSNRYIRFGYTHVPDAPFTYGSTYGAEPVPTMRIGNGTPSWWNHWDLRVLGK